jgi:hypothetical protein
MNNTNPSIISSNNTSSNYNANKRSVELNSIYPGRISETSSLSPRLVENNNSNFQGGVGSYVLKQPQSYLNPQNIEYPTSSLPPGAPGASFGNLSSNKYSGDESY